ncbi:MAG: 3-oxoacyl-ACP synthase [Proteobacteria bacterium]|nr:3-oxoacyl-ACP synthase [Pseudomonadota bacterium]
MKTSTIGITGLGLYIPENRLTATQIAEKSSIPEHVIKEKFGINSKPISDGERVTDMCAKAAKKAIASSKINPEDIDLVIYCGSDFKDHYVWSASVKICHMIGADKAIGYDMTALCVGMVMAMKHAKDFMIANPGYKNILLVSGTREESLIDYKNKRSRFMFNFAEGASAVVISRNNSGNEILEANFIVNGELSEFVHVPQVGNIAHDELTVEAPLILDVMDPEEMGEILNPISEGNFVSVIKTSLENSDCTLEDIDYLAILHMKRSIHDELLKSINLAAERTTYLDNYGHVQSSDPIISIIEGLKQKKITPGSLVVLAAAGTGYTWGAITLRWGDQLVIEKGEAHVAA